MEHIMGFFESKKYVEVGEIVRDYVNTVELPMEDLFNKLPKND